MRAGRIALLRGGPAAVRVEALARELKVTKGSFYWHFPDARALLEALLAEWEDEADLLMIAAGHPDGAEAGTRALFHQVAERVVQSERGEVPSDAAIFGWAAVDPAIAERVNRAEAQRVALLARLLGSEERAELAYMAYLGFILRRRRGPDPASSFRSLCEFTVGLAREGAGVEA